MTPATAVAAPVISDFAVARLPALVFGSDRIRQLPDLAGRFGRSVLLVTGGHSFVASSHWQPLLSGLDALGIDWVHESIHGEPSPEQVDTLVARHRERDIDVVVAIGGGSPLDAGKAIAGLLRTGTSVMDHLEGVGRGLPYSGPAVPLIAVPTTAGTGSEATKNAVLSRQGPDGFKKSFRDEQLVAQVALVDPDLLRSCPRDQLAANGMDAFTQLLESWVSVKASPVTDALAWSGMTAFHKGFWAVFDAEGEAPAAGLSGMAYASLMSGIALAQAGLGSVHGLASPLGAFFPIPHGVVCGTLVAEATAVNIEALQARAPDSPALPRYAQVGRLLGGQQDLDEATALNTLVDQLRNWTQRLEMPPLRDYGIEQADFNRICANARGGSMKTNPIVLSDAELTTILVRRI